MKPKNRFDVQIVLDNGGSICLMSRKDRPLSRADVVSELKWLIGRVEAYEAERAAGGVMTQGVSA